MGRRRLRLAAVRVRAAELRERLVVADPRRLPRSDAIRNGEDLTMSDEPRNEQRRAAEALRKQATEQIQGEPNDVRYGWYAPTWSPGCAQGGKMSFPTMPPWCPPQGGGGGMTFPPICDPSGGG